MSTFYDFSAKSLRGDEVPMQRYAGKVLLVVNTASLCGFTPQYTGLQKLYEAHANEGLEILGFPCNQFGRQEPGGVDAIKQTCAINYGVQFPMFSKVEVNGASAHPIFQYLTDALPGFPGKRIKWNFTKFLIGRDGKPLKRYAPITRPEAIEPDIAAALKA